MTVSFWLEDAGDDLTPRPPLDGPASVDVAVVGAGFTGLWTARELLRRDPSLEVLVIEAQLAGFGASGRNGAWLSGMIAVSPDELARRSSPVRARATIQAMRATVDEVIRACDEDGIDLRARRGGVLRVARGPHEAPQVERAIASLGRLGADDGVVALNADEVTARVGVADAHGALYDPHAAAIHPGRLVRGLARTVEAKGARLVESTRVTAVHRRSARGERVRIDTDHGQVLADAAVLATEAWLAHLPGYSRRVLPLYSLIVLTEPIDDATWQTIGWGGHELLSSHRYTVEYLSRTVDGRILFGGRGAPYHYGSRIDPSFDRHDPTHAVLREQLRSWFPQLGDVGFTHAWGGPLAMPRDWMPSIGFDRTTGIGAAYGYTGQGVATANLAGRILADLIVDGRTPFEELPMVGHRPRRWEPEPLRWLGARYLQRSLARIDARSASDGTPPTGRSLAERLLRH